MILSGLAVLGFLDGTSIQLNPNKIRVLNTPKIKYKLGKIRSKTMFGFTTLLPTSVINPNIVFDLIINDVWIYYPQAS